MLPSGNVITVQGTAVMGLVINVEDSAILREPIDRAFEAGKAKGATTGMASLLSVLLGNRFGGEVRDGLEDHLSDLQPEVLTLMANRLSTAQSVDDVLGSHMPARAQTT
jgi:hypothetical protein